MGVWVTDQAAAEFAGVTLPDARLSDALAAAEAHAQRTGRGMDCDPTKLPPADVQYAVKIRTKLLYTSRGAASQFADYDEYAQATDMAALGDYYALLGSRKPRVG